MLSSAASLTKAANIVASGASLVQASFQHRSGLAEEEKLHREEIKLMEEQFAIEMQTARRTYLLSMYADMETYFQELNENLISGSRDAERDMVDQRNQQFQTILVSATIMLTTLSGVIFQGILPEGTLDMYYVGYSLTSTISLICLFVNIVLCILITSRVNKFMYRRSGANIQHLQLAMKHTKDLMRNLRSEKGSNQNLNNHLQDDDSSSQGTGTPTVPSSLPTLVRATPVEGLAALHESDIPVVTVLEEARPSAAILRRQIAHLSDEEVEKEWKKHEDDINRYLNHRSKLSERLEELVVEEESAARMSFERYWTRYCKTMANLALVLFYMGTAFLLMATMVYIWVIFTVEFHVVAGASLSVATIGLSLIVALALAIYLRYFDASVVRMNVQIEQEGRQYASHYSRWMQRIFRSSAPPRERQRHGYEAEYKTN